MMTQREKTPQFLFLGKHLNLELETQKMPLFGIILFGNVVIQHC